MIRYRNATVESAVRTLGAIQALSLLFRLEPPFSFDGELVVGDLDLDVLLLDPREVK